MSGLSLTLHQRYRHRFGVVTSFALFETETYLQKFPSLSAGGKSTHLACELGMEERMARGAEHEAGWKCGV